MTVASRRGQWSQVLKLFDEWAAAGAIPTSGTCKREEARCYVHAITASGRLGLGERALRYFKEMQAAGCAPNVVIYTSVIRACATRKLWPAALSLFADLCGSDEK